MFYERFLYLCNKCNISPSLAAVKSGFNKGTVSVWKKKYESGIDVRPEPTVIAKICSFFDCTESWLLGIEEENEKPTVKDDGLSKMKKDLIKRVMNMSDAELDRLEQILSLVEGK